MKKKTFYSLKTSYWHIPLAAIFGTAFILVNPQWYVIGPIIAAMIYSLDHVTFDIIDETGITQTKILRKSRHINFQDLKTVITNGYFRYDINSDADNRVVFISTSDEKIAFQPFYENSKQDKIEKINLLKTIQSYDVNVFIYIHNKLDDRLFVNQPFKEIYYDEIEKYGWF